MRLLDAIVWSHWHWDHIGNGSKFPPSTNIVVGPGFTENFVPGYPENPDGLVLSSDFEYVSRPAVVIALSCLMTDQ